MKVNAGGGLFVLAAICAASSGCNTGRDNLLFVTRTNVAIDFDAVPMTTDIGYKRDELVIGPVDHEGKVLPVLTSVGVSASPLSFGANHSFATGEAALTLARYLGEKTKLPDVEKIDESTLRASPDNAIDPEGREPMFFGTNTVLGLGLTWNAQYVPTAVAIGYKRKELALVPLKNRSVAKLDANGKPIVGTNGKPIMLPSKQLAIPSLIATAQSRTQAGGIDSTGMVIGQTFATGYAATLLSTHPEVRAAIAPVIVPEGATVVAEEKAKQQSLAEAAEAEKADEQSKIQDDLITEIGLAFSNQTDQQKKVEIVNTAMTLGLVPEGTTTEKFRAQLRVGAQDGKNETTKALQKLKASLPK